MKKTIYLLVCAVLVTLCFAGCGAKEAPETTAAHQETESQIREAECPVCKTTVEWMGLTQAYVDTIRITNDQGKTIDSAIMSGTVFETRHYYLAEDLTYNDSPVMRFFRGPGNGLVSCLDLNDHNITTPATTSIFGNSGVLNVFGNGIVSGYSPNDHEGAAVRCGNRNSKNGLNLYGGTYKRTENTSKISPVVAFDGAGRCVSVYNGVVIDGGDGVAIFADSSTSREKEGYLLLRGCTVTGDVKLAAFDGYATRAELIGCTINGTVVVPDGHSVTVNGKSVIEKLSLGEKVRLSFGMLTDGTAIGVDASGIFTQNSKFAADYVKYFTSADPNKKISVKGEALSCD